MNPLANKAPELQISQWMNTDQAITLSSLHGRVVVLHAFQMLCPACVSHGLPQAKAINDAFTENEIAVIGIHTVFEHHDVMSAAALRAFMHEYRIDFPVGIDRADLGCAIPLTMQAYGLRGTPSLVLIDQKGAIRLQHFGQLDDLRAGALIGQLISEMNAESIS